MGRATRPGPSPPFSHHLNYLLDQPVFPLRIAAIAAVAAGIGTAILLVRGLAQGAPAVHAASDPATLEVP